ncbi:MAG TPA: GAF domain-containing protein, partial [Burkholderiales bacterium]|nr:GAF domain-containing protein [Burkholderiales bacterium]
MSQRTRKRATKVGKRKAGKPATLQRRLAEALAREAASAEILASIRRSRESPQAVLDAIVRNLQRLFGTAFAALFLARDGKIEIVAAAGKARFVRGMRAGGPTRLEDEELLAVRAMRRAQVLRLCPIIGNPEAPPKTERLARRTGFDSIIAAPMLRDGVAIGAVGTARTEAIPFDDAQVALIRSFADQAVIAIENARLFNDTKEALEQQTATAEILRVMSSSPSDVQPVFDAVARKTSELCSGNYAIVVRFDGELIHLAAQHNARPGADQATARRYPRPPGRETPSSRAILEQAVVHVPYADKDPDLPQDFVRRIGAGSFLSVPLLRQGRAIGAIGASRAESGPFPDKQIELVKVFADQAVIAIENARLFNETKEALEQQTATAEVLNAISGSVSDTAPVFEKILDSCQHLFATEELGIVVLKDDGLAHIAAWRGESMVPVMQTFPRPLAQTMTSRALTERRVIQVDDAAKLDPIPESLRAVVERVGHHSIAYAPMLAGDEAIGAIVVMSVPPRPLNDKQLTQLKTFADQAVIAIKNARQFHETREGLERQTATAEILKVIASSPSDTQPVFDAIAKSAQQLFAANSAAVARRVDDMLHLAAHTAMSEAGAESLRKLFPAQISGQGAFGKAVLTGKPAWIAD